MTTHDLSDNFIRGKMLTALIEAASETAPSKLPPWSLPKWQLTGSMSPDENECNKFMMAFPDKKHIILWRIDMPPKPLIYVGNGADLDVNCHFTYYLPKIMVDSKDKDDSIVGEIIESPEKITEKVIRSCLKSFAATELWSHHSNTILLNLPGCVMPLTCTTLAESVACFALHAPETTVACNIGNSTAWKENGKDPRYSEIQVGTNGFRLRDWCAMHINDGKTQQSRLAAHAVSFDYLYVTTMPWVSHEGVTTNVRVSSTLHCRGITLEGRTLESAVVQAYLENISNIPTLDEEFVDPKNCELYTDPSGTVGIAYALKFSNKIHILLFQKAEE